MRLPHDIIYRPPSQDLSRTQYAQEIRRLLERAYDTARSKLQLAHERQKDYYDRRTRGERFKPGDSVWLWSPAVKTGIAPKFHEPWTGPYKVTKRLSDVTYEILDVARKSKKVVHFDGLKKATVKPRAHILSESEPEKESSSEAESYDSEAPAISATKPKTVKPKSKERARKVAKDAEAAAVQPPEHEHNIEATAEPVPLAEPVLEAATSSGTSNETQFLSEPLCKLFEPLQPPDTRHIGNESEGKRIHAAKLKTSSSIDTKQ